MTEPAEKSIRILLVDDHSVFRTGLRMIIQARPGMEVVAEAGNREDALAAARQEQPDIILLDLDLGEADGAGLISDLLSASHQARVVVLTGVREAEAHRGAVLLGALGVVSKETAAGVLVDAIKKVHAGEAWLDPLLMANVIGEVSRAGRVVRHDPEAAKIASLTAREGEVIACICAGLGTKAAAERLCVSEKTLNHHLGSIFGKLGVGSRSELIVYAYRHGLAELPG